MLKAILILHDTKYFAKPWKMLGMFAIAYCLKYLVLGKKDASFFQMKSLKNVTARSSKDLTRWNWLSVKRHWSPDFCLPLGQKAECRKCVLKAVFRRQPYLLVPSHRHRGQPFLLVPCWL